MTFLLKKKNTIETVELQIWLQYNVIVKMAKNVFNATTLNMLFFESTLQEEPAIQKKERKNKNEK